MKKKYKSTGIIYQILNYRILVIFAGFTFQGIRYMELGEKMYKIGLTIFFAGFIYYITEQLLFSLFLGHLINFLVNGQLFVLSRYISNKQTMNKKKLLWAINVIYNNARSNRIKDILFFGSFSRGKMSSLSDLDVRVYHSGGLSSILTYIMATKLRLIFFLGQFPIDIYCFSNTKFLGPDKLDPNEAPVSMMKDKTIVEKYSDNILDLDSHLESIKIEN